MKTSSRRELLGGLYDLLVLLLRDFHPQCESCGIKAHLSSEVRQATFAGIDCIAVAVVGDNQNCGMGPTLRKELWFCHHI